MQAPSLWYHWSYFVKTFLVRASTFLAGKEEIEGRVQTFFNIRSFSAFKSKFFLHQVKCCLLAFLEQS